MTVSIPTPCQQNWSSFERTKHGGFCASCNKEVIDFTSWKPNEIHAYLSKKREGACGRLRLSQLGTYSSSEKSNASRPVKWLAPSLLSASLLLSPTESDAQQKEISFSYKITTDEIKNRSASGQTHDVEWEIRGKVTDNTGETMPGVNVRIKATNFGTVTNEQGEFNLTVHQNTGQSVLVFEFIGMITQEIPVHGNEQLDVTLKPDQALLDEVVIVGGICTYRWYSPRGWWYKIKGLFRRRY